MPTVTGLAYLQALADRLFIKRDARRGTADSGDTDTLVDTAVFQSSSGLTSKHVGNWITVYDTSGNVSGDARILSVTGASGTVELDRSVGFDIDSGDTFIITYEYHPDVLRNARDQVLRNIYTPCHFPLNSFVMLNDDWDMESDETITGMWGNTSGTLTKDTTYYFPFGTQSLKVVAGASPGYAKLATVLPVTEGKQYWASVLQQTTAGDSGEFRIVNVDDSNATIENATTDEVTWNELSFYFTPPTGCERIDAWLIATTNTDVCYFDDLIIEDVNQTIFPTPSWLRWESQMLGVFEMPRGSAGPAGDNDFRTLERRLRPVGWTTNGLSNISATQELQIQVERSTGNRRYIYAMRPGSALATDASTGYVDTDVVVENALYLLDEDIPDRLKNQRLRQLRESSLRAHVGTPEGNAVAYYR